MPVGDIDMSRDGLGSAGSSDSEIGTHTAPWSFLQPALERAKCRDDSFSVKSASEVRRLLRESCSANSQCS